MAAGLKEVAARAGVSMKTVSNVVHGYQYVRPGTRTRVEEAIDALGYRPNLSARSLRGGRTGVIALALPELTSPYFAEIATGVIAAAGDRGWTVLIDSTGGVRERELAVLRGIRTHLIDGVILSPLAVGAADLRSVPSEVPVVLIGERVPAGSVPPFVMDHVAIDNVAAARAATQHLVATGRRRVAAIGAQVGPTAETARLRLRGYRAALRDAGLGDPDPHLEAAVVDWHRPDGQAAVGYLLSAQPVPDAVLCFNDLLALGALRGLARRGVRVPEDVAVAGIDDIEEGRYSTPTLTTVAPDKEAIALAAVELLAARMDEPAGAGGPPQEVEAGFRLVVRESSVPKGGVA